MANTLKADFFCESTCPECGHVVDYPPGVEVDGFERVACAACGADAGKPRRVSSYAIGQRITVSFPRLNKQGTLDEYREQADRRTVPCEVEKVLMLTAEEYDAMAEDLLADYNRLGTGGTNSDADLPEGWDYFRATEEERAAFKAQAYNLVTVVQAPRRETIFINPEGHAYPRYVGFDVDSAAAPAPFIDVSTVAREAGFKVPVRLSRAVYEDCVAWAAEDNARKGCVQEEAGRLWDVVYMLSLAARKTNADTLLYGLYRVPREGRGRKARLTTLRSSFGPGPDGAPQITISLPSEQS